MWKIIENGYTLGYLPRPLVIVVVEGNPFTVGWHTPINKKPFKYLIAIDKNNYSYSLIKEDLTINFLESKYTKDFLIFGTFHGNDVDKKKLLSLNFTESIKVKSLTIEESFMVYECKIDKVEELNDHSIVIVDVVLIKYKKGKLKPKNKVLFYMGKNYYCFNTTGFYKKI